VEGDAVIRWLAIASVMIVAACETPPLVLRFKLTDSQAQRCIGDTGVPATSCSDITMDCDAVLGIRIVPPNQPEIPYVSLCKPLIGSQDKLCSIAGVPLPQAKVPVPEQVLEVQMAVFRRDQVGVDEQGNLVCPIVEFAADNLPVVGSCPEDGVTQCPARPAVGGRAFYHPGDLETVVELGCTELELLRGEKCSGMNRTEVIAYVNEFEFPNAVDPVTANHLFVSLGEPTIGSSGNYVLEASSTYALVRGPNTASATWTGNIVDLNIASSFCIEVLEDAPMATRTLTCRKPPLDPSKIDAVGVRLKPSMLSDILMALQGNTVFPPQGLVVGIVLSQSLSPVAGASVTTSCPNAMDCAIQYWSADRQSFTSGAGATTSANGIFVSTNAPYGTRFSRAGLVGEVFGGLVEGKVTIVVLQESTVVGP
jgi:hypothetical protein